MRTPKLKTKIFLDGGDPAETKEALNLLGFLDGQTTNPTLISKNPAAREQLERDEKFDEREILYFYQKVVKEISALIPRGSVSVEVYADEKTTTEEMLKQAREMFSWIPDAHIKLPINQQGLQAAEQAVREGMRINMTLCFSQEQAAAVYAATRGAEKGQVFVSPFVGRLDDRGENGMDLIENIIKMYEVGDGHVEVLTASVRNMGHLLFALKLGTDIVTVPFKLLKEWAEKGLALPDENFVYDAAGLRPISYQVLGLEKDWHEYNIQHELTVRGMERFSEDWNKLIRTT